MPEQLFCNDTDLSTLVRNIESLAGLLRTPTRRGGGILVPGRHGRFSRADRPYDAGECVLPMWVIGADTVTGVAATGEAAVTAFYARADELLALLAAPALLFRHVLPDGSERVVRAELAEEPLEFTRQAGHPLFGRVTVTVTLPDAFWYEPDPVTTGALSFTTGQERALSVFAGSTAPIADLEFLIAGPANNPEIHQTATGAFVAYDGVIGAGQTLTIHCDDTVTAPLAGTGGLTPDYTALRYLPPRWFELDPAAGLDLTVVHTGGGTIAVTTTGQRKFLTG